MTDPGVLKDILYTNIYTFPTRAGNGLYKQNIMISRTVYRQQHNFKYNWLYSFKLLKPTVKGDIRQIYEALCLCWCLLFEVKFSFRFLAF